MQVRVSTPQRVRRLVEAAGAIAFMAGLGALPLAARSGVDSPASLLAGSPAPSSGAIAYDCASQAQVPTIECEALVALYNSASGPGWHNKANWLADNHPCGWYGVGCSQGSVVVLNLNDNGLSGTIPAEIGDLANLYDLRFHGNQLGGPIPTTLANLSKLRDLDLTANRLSGTIPPALGNLSELTDLSLNWNQLTGTIPPELGKLSNLETLFLSNNKLTGPIPAALGALGKLKWLILVDNQLTGPIPAELGNLASLEWIALDNNPLNCPIPPELGNLANLNRLNMTSTGVSGPVPPELGGLADLAWLGLGWNQLSGKIPAELGNLSGLKELHLMGNQLTGEIPPELGNLAGLERLYLFGNQLTGKIPVELGACANMKDLHLGGNQLTGKIPSELGNLAGLEHLWLGGNLLAGEIPPELGRLASLKALNLSSNQLSGGIPVELGGVTGLEELALERNGLSGQVPVGVATVGGAVPLPGQCRLTPGNWGLYMLTTAPYKAADLDGDGLICGLPLMATPLPTHDPVKAVVDLGSLGGDSFARAVNDQGQVVGGAFDEAGQLRPFAWSKSLGMVDLGTPHPGFQCEARDVAPAGGAVTVPSIVGTCCAVFDAGRLECEGPGEHVFMFRPSKKSWALFIPGADGLCADTAAYSIVGTTFGGCQFAADQPMRAAYWGQGGHAWALPGTGSGRFSVASAADAYPGGSERPWQTAGTFETASGALHAFFYVVTFAPHVPGPPIGSITDLGTLGGSFSKATGVNRSGQVVGVSETASGRQHAFLWTASDGMIDLGTLGGQMSIATGINDLGQVVGYTEGYGTVVAFLWTPAQGMMALSPPAGAGGWGAFGINNAGAVVGAASMPGPGGSHLRAMMWVLK